jgi:hypothetical protein
MGLTVLFPRPAYIRVHSLNSRDIDEVLTILALGVDRNKLQPNAISSAEGLGTENHHAHVRFC